MKLFIYCRFTEYVSLSPQSDEFLSPSDADTTGKVDIPSLNMDLMGDLQEVINRQCTISERTEVESFPSGYRIVSILHSSQNFAVILTSVMVCLLQNLLHLLSFLQAFL